MSWIDDLLAAAKVQWDIDARVYRKDGLDWFEAPVPPRKHECFVQMAADLRVFERVERCACGAIREAFWPKGAWIEKNSRRSDEPPPKRTRG